MIRIVSFQIVHFTEKLEHKDTHKVIDKEVLILYGLGEDGIVYEMTGGKWLALPVNEETIRKLEVVKPIKNDAA